MSEPMSDERLDYLKDRWAGKEMSVADIESMFAELDRLRAENDNVRAGNIALADRLRQSEDRLAKALYETAGK